MKHLITLCLIPALCLLQLAAPQQERQYTVSIPAHLVNSYLMLMNGQLNQMTAADYKELQEVIPPQIYQQYRQYMKEDSVIAARQKAALLKSEESTTKQKIDSLSKYKKP